MAKKVAMPLSSAGIISSSSDVDTGSFKIEPIQLVIAIVVLTLIIKVVGAVVV